MTCVVNVGMFDYVLGRPVCHTLSIACCPQTGHPVMAGLGAKGQCCLLPSWLPVTGVNLPNMGTTKPFLHDTWHFVTSLDVELGVGVGERGRGGGGIWVGGGGGGVDGPGVPVWTINLGSTASFPRIHQI
jgi:hypothetical protein